MSQLKKLFSKPFFKAFIGVSTLGGLGYAAYYQLNEKQASQLSPNIINPIDEQQKEIITSIQPPIIQASQSPQQQPVTNIVAPEVTTPNNEPDKQVEPKLQTIENKVQQQQQTIFSPFNKLNEIVQFKLQEKFKPGEMILIVADLPFTPDFEVKIVAEINRLKSKFKSLKVYRKDILSQQSKKYFQKEFNAKIEDHTLFLLRNTYDKGLNYFNFDMYMQYPVLLEAYLRDSNRFQQENIKDLKNSLASLNPYESCAFYLYDKSEPVQKVRERMMTAKFIEMEFVVNNLKGVKLFVVEKAAAINSGLVDEKNSRVNSLHLFRKHNIYTPFDPNFKLELQNKEQIPFFRLSDIALFQSKSNRLMIPSYLSGLQTFDSSEVAAPYICSLRIDRNKINEEDYNKLIKIFGQFKKNNLFPDIAFTLKLKNVPYAGKDRPKNQEWQITLANTDQMQKQTMMHEITHQEQLKLLGFTEASYMKTRPQYIFEDTIIDKDSIEQFLKKGIKGKLSKYYKSEQKHPLANLRKTTGQTFSRDILQNGKDHVLYEYSEACPTCKKISPYLSALVEYIEKKGLGLEDVEFHRLDANKNRVRNYISSPYIPNLYYYKKDWNNSPAKFPIEFLSYGVSNLYHFFLINKQIKTIPWKQIDDAVTQHLKYRNEILSL